MPSDGISESLFSLMARPLSESEGPAHEQDDHSGATEDE